MVIDFDARFSTSLHEFLSEEVSFQIFICWTLSIRMLSIMTGKELFAFKFLSVAKIKRYYLLMRIHKFLEWLKYHYAYLCMRIRNTITARKPKKFRFEEWCTKADILWVILPSHFVTHHLWKSHCFKEKQRKSKM